MSDMSYYLDYISDRMDRKENIWSSFTYGNALYDFICEWRSRLEYLWAEEAVIDEVVNMLDANREAVSNLSDRALVEIVDISVLDAIGRDIEEEVFEEEKKEIFDDLDLENIEFETFDQLVEKIKEIKECYHIETSAEELAEEYNDKNDLQLNLE